MKRLIFILALLPFTMFAQEWAPVGAKWHYGVLESVASYVEGHLLYESIGDTVVLGKNCRIIKKTRTYYNNNITYPGIELMYEDSGRIYHLLNNNFYVIYDFNAQTNDSWTTRIPYEHYGGVVNPNDSMRLFTVDSTDQLILGSDTLKVLYATPDTGDWNYKLPIIERIGGHYMFAGIWGLWDLELPYLRCYEDSNIYYETNSGIPCDTIISNVNTFDKSAISFPFSIHPNPTSGKFEVSSLEFGVAVQVYDLLGKEVTGVRRKVSAGAMEIDLSYCPAGIYFVRVGESTAKLILTE